MFCPNSGDGPQHWLKHEVAHIQIGQIKILKLHLNITDAHDHVVCALHGLVVATPHNVSPDRPQKNIVTAATKDRIVQPGPDKHVIASAPFQEVGHFPKRGLFCDKVVKYSQKNPRYIYGLSRI